MQKRTLIGVMDSGFGGLSVLSELSDEMPEADYIYYGDLMNSPYGDKTTEEVLNLTDEICKFFTAKGTDAILIACNTATSASIKAIRSKYNIPIFGMEPAIKPALTMTEEHKKIAVFATSLTLSEEKFSELSRALSGEDRIYPVVCDGLAKLIDKEDLKGAENFIRPLLENIKSQEIKSIVLGCTHYSLIKPLFYKIYPGVKIFDGNSGTARHIHRQISPHDDGKDCKLDLFLNGGTDEDFQIAYRYLNREMEAGNE